MSSSLPHPVPQVGTILRGKRKARKLTLDALAKRSGVSKSLLSQVERGHVNPTFAVLWNLTQALGITLSELADNSDNAQTSPVVEHIKAYSTPTITSADGKVTLRMLSPVRTVLDMEWYEVILAPKSELHNSPHSQGTYLHLSAQTGALEVHIQRHKMQLEVGETLRFEGNQSYQVYNPSEQSVRALLVIALPSQYQGGSA